MSKKISTSGKFIGWKPRGNAEIFAFELVKRLRRAGYDQTYIVGGYVRDYILKRSETGAIDLATEAEPTQVGKVLGRRYKIIPTGLKHGTLTVHSGKIDIEITTLRAEGKYTDYRHPDRVRYVRDVRLDAARRDFTVNALYLDPINRTVLDYYDGCADIAAKRLRFVGSASKRIEEDPLRMMRAMRFSSVLDFKISKEAFDAIRSRAILIGKISPERIKQELDKIMATPGKVAGLRLLRQSGLLQRIFPELERLSSTPQSKNYHSEGNVWIHTLLALDNLENGASLRTVYGVLFHDIGKAVTLVRTIRNGRSHTSFHNHQLKGSEIAGKILHRLRFSNDEIDEIVWYVRNHHVPFEIRSMRKAKQMTWCLDPRFENLLKIYRADSLSSIPTDANGRKQKPQLTTYMSAMRLWKRLKLSEKTMSKPLVTGRDVMRIMRIPESPKIGDVLREIRELQLAEKLKSRTAALAYLKKSAKVL